MSKIIGPNLVTSGLVLHLDAANPKSYQSGSTSWFDMSGNGNSGTLISGSGYSSANFGSITFDGVNDYVDGTAIDLQSQITVLIFIRPAQRTGTNYPSYITKWQAIPGNNRSWLIGMDPQNNKEVIAVSSTGAYNSSVIKRYEMTGIDYNMWKQIGFTFNNGVLIPYKNGVPAFYSASLDPSITTIYTSNTTVKLGYDQDGVLDAYFSGSISSVQIYNRALSPSEVLQNFNAVRGRFGI